MPFWRTKTNSTQADAQRRDDRLLHHKSDLTLEPPPTETDPVMNPTLAHDLAASEQDMIDTLTDETPTPDHYGRPLFPNTPIQAASAEVDNAEMTGGWLSRLSAGLTKTTTKMTQGLTDLVAKKKLGADQIALLEEILLSADVGPRTTQKILSAISAQLVDRDVTPHDLKKILAAEITAILAPCAKPLLIRRPDNGPFTMLVCGVNGVGKTTTIGKLAKIMHDQKHHRVMMVAGDTFRAAAIEQLQIWGTRAHTPVVTRDIGADAAALAYESWEQARQENVEVILIDTAGRLHNKSNLMQELQKIVRVLKKHDDALPHEVLLVLDGTTGQNAVNQVQTFKEMVNVTGLIVTKLDGSAKGGVVVALADQFALPIYAVGVGESAEDLQPFTAEGYSKALVGLA